MLYDEFKNFINFNLLPGEYRPSYDNWIINVNKENHLSILYYWNCINFYCHSLNFNYRHCRVPHTYSSVQTLILFCLLFFCIFFSSNLSLREQADWWASSLLLLNIGRWLLLDKKLGNKLWNYIKCICMFMSNTIATLFLSTLFNKKNIKWPILYLLKLLFV
jgi:hypothetical protein